MRPPFLILALLVIATGFAFLALEEPVGDARVLSRDQVDLSVDYSNILPDDYVGPDACISCHEDHYRNWKSHPHSRMNQLPTAKTVSADFEDATLQLPDATARFTREGDRYFMTIERSGSIYRHYSVTRTVGSRYMQYFIGVQLSGREGDGDPVYQEHMLPFAYWFALKRWFPRRYFDADGDEEVSAAGVPLVEAVNSDPAVRPYTANCMNCHNTFPYIYRIYHEKLAGFPGATISASIDSICGVIERPDVSGSVDAFAGLNRQLDPDSDLVSLGISCESCHFGGREHAELEREIKYLPTSPFLKLAAKDARSRLAEDGSTAATINGICSQCHSGGGLRFPEGALKSNSAEGIDFQKGFCSSEMSCVDCHDPHSGSRHESGFESNSKHIQSCLRCHGEFQDLTYATKHSGHDSASGVSCLDCHMPRYNQGVNGLARTHRICMPVEPAKMATSGANACNVCHVDKSLRWTLRALKQWWNVEIHPDRSWHLAKKLDLPAGQVWGKGEDNHMRFVATECLSRQPDAKEHLDQMIPALTDPEPLNRAHAENAIRRVIGTPPERPLPVDIHETPRERRRQIARWLERLAS